MDFSRKLLKVGNLTVDWSVATMAQLCARSPATARTPGGQQARSSASLSESVVDVVTLPRDGTAVIALIAAECSCNRRRAFHWWLRAILQLNSTVTVGRVRLSQRCPRASNERMTKGL